MALLQIKDPLKDNKVTTSTNEDDITVGIDLGTTNSVVGFFQNGKVDVLSLPSLKLIPSVVMFTSGGVLVGPQVNDSSRASIFGDSLEIKSVKRLLGRCWGDIPERVISSLGFIDNKLYKAQSEADAIKIPLPAGVKLDNLGESKPKFNNFITPEEVSAYILQYLKSQIEHKLKKPLKKVVITVPAYFTEQARLATKKAAELVELQVIRLINEPTAAALAYGLDNSSRGTYLVFDLGGGTFDVSIIELIDGVFRVIATAGDNYIGGDDIDLLIANYLQDKIPDIGKYIDFKSLLGKSKAIKEDLTEKEEIEVTLGSDLPKLKFTKLELNSLIQPLVERTIQICNGALKDASLTKDLLKGIVMVGGSTRLPKIQETLKEYYGLPLFSSINPDEVVAIGAGWQAANLSGKISKSLLLDISPLSLGVETYGGNTEKIIDRNSPIPISKTQIFTTFQNNQTGFSFHVVQGERELAKDNQSLARFSLKGIPPLPAGVAKVEVNFTIDVDGLLTVVAKEQTTGIKQVVEIKPSFNLTEESIKEVITDGLKHSQEDLKKRLLINQKTKAKQLINIVEDILRKDKALISSSEIEIINQKTNDLKALLMNSNIDIESLKLAIAELNLATNNLAQKRIEKALNSNK